MITSGDNETKNPFTVMDFNIDDVKADSRLKNPEIVHLMEALKNLPIEKNKCICVNKTHFKDNKSAYTAISQSIKYLKKENSNLKDAAFKMKIKKDVEKNWTGTYVWRLS